VAFAPPLQPLPAFLERPLNGFGERLAGLAGYLAGQLFGGSILDEQGHVLGVYTREIYYISFVKLARVRRKSFPDRAFWRTIPLSSS
jgi:hypothetical protein